MFKVFFKAVLFGLILSQNALADSWTIKLKNGGEKVFTAKPQAIRYALQNEKDVQIVTECRQVVLTEKLSFKKLVSK